MTALDELNKKPQNKPSCIELVIRYSTSIRRAKAAEELADLKAKVLFAAELLLATQRMSNDFSETNYHVCDGDQATAIRFVETKQLIGLRQSVRQE